LSEHIAAEGPDVFAHACRLGAEGIVSKRLGSAYNSGLCHAWVKVKNPDAVAQQRERAARGPVLSPVELIPGPVQRTGRCRPPRKFLPPARNADPIPESITICWQVSISGLASASLRHPGMASMQYELS
jgi:hypothetical protein